MTETLRLVKKTAKFLDDVQGASSQARLIPLAAVVVPVIAGSSVKWTDSSNLVAAVGIMTIVEIVLVARFIFLRRSTREAASLIVATFHKLNKSLPGNYQPNQFKELTPDWFAYHSAILQEWGYKTQVEPDQDYVFIEDETKRANDEYYWYYDPNRPNQFTDPRD